MASGRLGDGNFFFFFFTKDKINVTYWLHARNMYDMKGSLEANKI